MNGNLTGNYMVRALRHAFSDVAGLCERTRDRISIRRHALKLRYWPEKNPADESGTVLDLDWSWIRSLPNTKIGELRIQDVIGGNDNLRIIFFVGDRNVIEPLPLPPMWVLAVLQKKRDEFRKHDLAIFKARRTFVLERFYSNRP